MNKQIAPLIGIAVLLGAGLVWKSGILSRNGQKPTTAIAAGASGAAANTPPIEARRFPSAKVVVAEVREKMMSPAAAAPGSIVSIADSRIASEVSGKITWIAEVGDEIDEGAVIAIIDDAPAALTLRERQAEAARLRSRAAFLANRYERFASLGDDLGESETSLMQMRSERDEAQQQLNSAKVATERAEFVLDRTKVRAPFAGRVVARQVQIGEFANQGSEIARLVDTRNLEVRSQASASLVTALSAGDPISVINGKQTIIGRVRAIVPVGDEISRTLEMRISLPVDTGWFVGSAVRVTVPSARPRVAIAAPRDALHIRNNQIDVYKIDADNRAIKISVELGVADGDLIEIIGDVAPGDKLVIRGGERLNDGQMVEIIPQVKAEAA